jgi:pimeloyl-ACP methyl ester carboxylesterase
MEGFTFRSRAIAFGRFGDGVCPVVFLHGLGAEKAQTMALLGASVDLDVIATDAPSHGQSDVAPELHSFDAMADTLVALLDHLGVATAIFGGVSMGAGVSLNAAVRYPERVRGLVLVRPAWLDRPSPPNLDIVSRLGGWIMASGPSEAGRLLRRDPWFVELSRVNPASAASIEGVLDRPGIGDRAGVLVDMTADSPVASPGDLGRVEAPALVLATEHDPLHPSEMAREVAERLPRGSLRATAPRYLEPERHAGEVRDAIMGFLGDSVRGGWGTG